MEYEDMVAGAMRRAGFSNIHATEVMVCGDVRRGGVLYTLQMILGGLGEYPILRPALLIGDGDFPRRSHVYDDGHAITAAMRPEPIINSVLARIQQSVDSAALSLSNEVEQLAHYLQVEDFLVGEGFRRNAEENSFLTQRLAKLQATSKQACA